MALGTFDDMWFQWIIDFGMPGPDRGAGGKFLLVPPGYDGPLPEGGFYVGHSRTNRVLMLGRSFMQDDDPAPTVATIKSDPQDLPLHARAAPGPASPPSSRARSRCPARPPTCPRPPSSRAAASRSTPSHRTTPGSSRPSTRCSRTRPSSAADPEIIGHLAEIGIVKGKPFAPDDRMRRILDDAAAVGNATSRALMFDARGEEDVACYPGSAWTNMLFGGGYLFDRPIPQVTPEGIKPYPPTGARKHDLRTLFFYGYTGITPAMAMRLTGIGSQYLVAFMDSNKDVLRRRPVVHRDAAARHPRGPVLVAHALRQPDPIDARDAAAIPPGRQPVVPEPGGGRERRRFDHHPPRPRAARRRRRRQLDPDDAGQGVLRRPPALQPARSRSSTSPGRSASSSHQREATSPTSRANHAE